MSFILYADKNRLVVRRREPVTSGSVNAYSVRFEFSDDWNGLARTAVFQAGGEPVSILLDDSNECGIPWEAMVKHGVRLKAGVYGTRDGEIVLPTIWADLGEILQGTATKSTPPPTPDLYEQLLASMQRKGEALDYDGLNLSLMCGDEALSTVQITGGGDGGVSDHRLLTGRDAEAQHPISSIEGLSGELARIPEPVEPLTNEELEELLK